MKLLLINPKFPESFWSFTWAMDAVVRNKKAVNSPLGLATLAALTPGDWDITIIDENVEPINWSAEADIVGVCGMGVQAPRQKEILDHFRRRGIYTVAGGSYASLCPEEYEGLVDTVISGEAENIWPKFCADFVSGHPEKLYRETETIDITKSPAPRYDLLKLGHYQKVSLQFSRGCPFQCEFCDIIVMFGRRPRTKTVEQVGRELDLLREQGVTSVFFVDDNLIGNRALAKELLRFLTEYQEKHRYRFSFGTEASINMAEDPDLMGLFRKANFEWVFIGIESPSAESLKETKKSQNLHQDLLTSIRTIYSYGIDIFAGFIVGFDSDDKTIFDRQYDFIVSSGIAVAMVGLLYAAPKTPLHKRLHEAGRLRKQDTSDNTGPSTNVIPLRMTYDELVEGHRRLYERLLTDRVSSMRLANKLDYMKNPLTSPHFSLGQKLGYTLRLLRRGIIPGGMGRIYYFMKSFVAALRHPALIAVVMTDWIAILSLKSFWDRSLDRSVARTETVLSLLQKRVISRMREAWQGGLIALRLNIFKDRPHVWIDLKQSLDGKVSRVLARIIRRTLKKNHEAVVIDCRAVQPSNWMSLEVLLQKLRRCRNQIHIRLTDELYQKLGKRLELFHYTLIPIEV
ncbi:MAG: B12-binding domain-containing radical SAM protein [Deltaproteobacteria bacterium]|nr:B12-binding domain-containing radical SAM protein [Deltaproteobacteria bacterium]